MLDLRDRDITLAWHVAAFNASTKSKKGIPTLASVLHKKRSTPRQTPAEQAAIWQMAAAVFGGQFTPLDPKTVIIRD